MEKNFAVYKRVVGVGTERVSDIVAATDDFTAISKTVGHERLGVAGALGFMDTYFRAYRDLSQENVYYFAGEVY